MAADADDPVAVADQLGDRDAVTDLGAGFGGGVGEQRIEDGASDAHGGVDAVDRDRRALEDDVAEVEADVRHERDAGGADPLEQAPAGEVGHAGGLDGVAGEDVAAGTWPGRRPGRGGPGGPAAWRWGRRRSGSR